MREIGAIYPYGGFLFPSFRVYLGSNLDVFPRKRSVFFQPDSPNFGPEKGK